VQHREHSVRNNIILLRRDLPQKKRFEKLTETDRQTDRSNDKPTDVVDRQ